MDIDQGRRCDWAIFHGRHLTAKLKLPQSTVMTEFGQCHDQGNMAWQQDEAPFYLGQYVGAFLDEKFLMSSGHRGAFECSTVF